MRIISMSTALAMSELRWILSFFFYKQKTAYEMRISAWGSDVCSSDLFRAADRAARIGLGGRRCAREDRPEQWRQRARATHRHRLRGGHPDRGRLPVALSGHR